MNLTDTLHVETCGECSTVSVPASADALLARFQKFSQEFVVQRLVATGSACFKSCQADT